VLRVSVERLAKGGGKEVKNGGKGGGGGQDERKTHRKGKGKKEKVEGGTNMEPFYPGSNNGGERNKGSPGAKGDQRHTKPEKGMEVKRNSRDLVFPPPRAPGKKTKMDERTRVKTTRGEINRANGRKGGNPGVDRTIKRGDRTG